MILKNNILMQHIRWWIFPKNEVFSIKNTFVLCAKPINQPNQSAKSKLDLELIIEIIPIIWYHNTSLKWNQFFDKLKNKRENIKLDQV